MRRIQTGVLLTALLLASVVGTAEAAPSLNLTSGSGTTSSSGTGANGAPTGPLDITISPVVQDLVTKPGSPVTVSYQIKNNGPQTEQLKATVKTFKSSGQSGLPQLETPGPNDDFVHWVNIPTPVFSVEPGVWETFTLTISPPKTAAFGYYYAINFTRAQQAAAGHGNSLVVSVDGLILLDVQAPGEKRQASLVRFSTPNRVIEFLPENFTVLMHNSGNVHVAPQGNLVIYKGGKAVRVLDVNDSGGNILPNSDRTYSVQWKDGTPVYKSVSVKAKDAKNQDTTKLDWSNFKFSSLRYGKYNAQLEMIYNNGQYDVPITAQLSFWVIPWRILFAAAVAVLFIAAGIWALFIRPIRSRVRGKRGHARFR